MNKLKKLFKFINTQVEKAGVSPKYSGLVSIIGTLVLAIVLTKLTLLL